MPCCMAVAGCSASPAKTAASNLFAASAQSFASDDDPALIGEASPFTLKLIETLIRSNPEDGGLLLAASRGFSQYAFGYIQQQADELEDKDLALARQHYERAKNLYRRAQGYGWRGLDLAHPKIQERLHKDLPKGLKAFKREDVPLMYWTALALGGLINLSKDSAELIAEVPIMEGLMDRALELDESFDTGVIHQFLAGYEMNRRHRKGDPAQLARSHFFRAVQLSQGKLAASFVILAEGVCVREQNRAEFERLLDTAMKIDPNAAPQWRLANLLWQQRARWLLTRKEQLFTE
jgi:predicted anti-sigma-YlaC factor YlaD